MPPSPGHTGDRPRVRVAAALMLAAALAACGPGPDVILPGEREPLRPGGETAALAEAAPLRLAAPQANAEWTHRNGGPEHAITHPALGAAPQLAWSVPIGQGDTRRARITADPVVSGGRVFALDSRAQVTAVSEAGAPLWSADLTPPLDGAGDASGGGLAVAGDTLFVSLGFGDLVALDVATGAERWRQELDASGAGAPAVRGGLVYIVSRDSRAWAIDAGNGRVRWTLDAAPDAVGLTGGAAPAVTSDLVIFPFPSGEVQAAFRQGGLRRWDAAVTGRRPGQAIARIGDISADPVVAGGRVYAANQSGRLVALNLQNGQRIWTAEEGALSPVWPAGGAVFLVSDQNQLVRLDGATGAPVWRVDLPEYLTDRPLRLKEAVAHYGPVLAGGQLLVASNDGLLRSFDPASGALISTRAIPGGATSNPVVANGTLYIVSARGDLHAFR